MILSGVTTPGHSGPVNDGNEGVLDIPQSPNFTEASPLNCLSYLGHSLGVSTSIVPQKGYFCIK